MANSKRTNYNITITQDFKQRLLRLPVKSHRGLAVPMRAHLEKLVERAEARQSQNGGK